MQRLLLLAACCAALLATSLVAADAVAPVSATVESSTSLPELLGALGVTDAAPFPCTFTAPDGKYFDFSSMTTASGTAVDGESSNEKYWLNVCGAVTPPQGGDCITSKASVCMQFTYSPAGQWYSIANYDKTPAASPPAFSLITPGNSADGVQLTYNNGDFAGQTVQAVMRFKCTTDADVKYSALHSEQSKWIVSVSSSKACPGKAPGGGGGSSGGLSGGWVFIIILLVVSFVYVGGGCLFKRQKQGTQGMESCPNVDFWRGLPGLVKDGCAFFVLKVKGLMGKGGNGGGASGGESDYSTFK